MNATFRYNPDEVRAIILAHHVANWSTPEGHAWDVQSEGYGILSIKVELTEQEAKEKSKKGEA